MKKILLTMLMLSNLLVYPQWSNDPSINTEVIIGFNEFNPQTTSDGSGGAIVIWQTFDGLYAQRISPMGYKLWNSSGVIVNNAYVTYPQILSDGSGGAFICWVDNRGGDDDIYLQRIDNNGSPLWTANGIAVCNESLSYQDSPVMCPDNSGGVYVAWRDDRNTNSDIYAQIVNSTGGLVGGNIVVCSDFYDQVSPQIASDGSGNAIIVWTDSRNFFSTLDDIYAQKINLSGTSLWLSDGESVCSASNNQSNARLVNSGTDEVIVAWEDERGSDKDIYSQKIITNNTYLETSWTYDGEIICSESANQYNIELVSNSNGEAIFSWVDERNGAADKDIYAQRVYSLGTPAWANNGVVICDEVNDQIDQEIVSDGYGGAIINWTDSRALAISSDIYAQRIGVYGDVQWTSNGIVLANAANEQLEPSVVILNPNNFFTAFTDKRTGSDIYCQKFLIDGSLPVAAPSGVDGVISVNEYGDIQNSYFAGNGVTWYMKMDESYIYVGVSGYTNSSDAVVIYLSNSRITPVNYIDNSYGSVIGSGYDGVTPNLPFRSTYFAFVKPGYDDYKYFDGSGAWGPSTVNGIFKSYNGGNQVIEFAIPWSSLPSIDYVPRYGMNWLGFLSYAGGGGGTFARVPTENPAGTNPDMGWYFDTGYASFGGGIIDFPFHTKCYTHVGNDILNFGDIAVSNFTLNSPGKQIIRTSGDWNIGGVLLVNNGTLTFNSNNPVNVQTLEHYGGEIRFSSGLFDAPLNLHRIYRESSAGPLIMDAGQTTTFLGTSPFFSDQGTEIIQLQNVILQSDSLDLYSDMTINQSLDLNTGDIQTNGFNLILAPGVIVTGTGYINGALQQSIPTSPSALGKGNGIENYLVNFPIGTDNGPSPVSIDFSSVAAGGTVSVQAVQTVHPNSVVSSESMKRYWKITKDENLSFTSADITFNYLPQDFNTAFFEDPDEASMVVGKYDTGSWTFPNVSNRFNGGTNDGGSITISGVNSFSDFTTAKSEASVPVELTAFNAVLLGSSVKLNWTTATEINNYGFEIEKTIHTSTPLSVTKWEKIGFVSASGNSISEKNYSFTDSYPSGGSKFVYRLKQIDNDGTFSYSDIVEVEIVPNKFELSQNYPNPFNPSTKIKYTIPNVTLSGVEGSRVQLKVYDILGNEVATLINEEKPAGVYEVEFNASNLSSGVYLYKLTAGSFTETKKMTVLK